MLNMDTPIPKFNLKITLSELIGWFCRRILVAQHEAREAEAAATAQTLRSTLSARSPALQVCIHGLRYCLPQIQLY